jgi:putative glycerol-1-phosphate prenyltransferase
MRPVFYPHIIAQRGLGRKSLAILLDPDKTSPDQCRQLLARCGTLLPTCFMVGGSLITGDGLGQLVGLLKAETGVPIVLFPGSYLHLNPEADAVLFLSLISGRNPEFLIGQQVVAAPLLKRSGLEIVPTGYMLVNCGAQTTVSYMSNTTPLPYNKDDVAAATALAGELLGLRLLYLDGGSGAQRPVSASMVRAVRQVVDLPLIVGGGIRSADTLNELFAAGADMAVVGTAIEQDPELLPNLVAATNHWNH